MKKKVKPPARNPEREEVQKRHVDCHKAANKIEEYVARLAEETGMKRLDVVFALSEVLHRRMCQAWWQPKMDKILKETEK